MDGVEFGAQRGVLVPAGATAPASRRLQPAGCPVPIRARVRGFEAVGMWWWVRGGAGGRSARSAGAVSGSRQRAKAVLTVRALSCWFVGTRGKPGRAVRS
ncbi:hypothetical protein GCM10023235_13110 [Kitasatospora terrestris]|uniref:Uncharacterized protein n=1 Tax=Kitasatospora terrestris TaxID=258051 RepID=A0ABP9DD39_9ACTN